MFSRKNLNPAPSISVPGFNASELMSRAFANPYLGAGGAAALFITTGMVLISLLGDPHAGTPQVRISLAKVAAMAAPPGWREALRAQQPGLPTVTEDVYQLTDSPVVVAAADNQATITMTESIPVGPRDPLPQAPIAGLTSEGPGGLLPIIGGDGRTPAQAYARPFTSNGRPKIALMIGGLGLNATSTRQAIEQLPPEITLSFVPYAEGLQGWIDLARANGHEVLLETPMEPMDYPANDPGPYTLMANAQNADTVRKLEWLMSRATGYFGVTNYLGSRFVGSDAGMAAFTGALRGRGLAFVDDGSAAKRGGGVPRASAERIIDDQLSGAAIDQQLLALEAGALQKGQALGSAFAYPITLSQVSAWAKSVESRGYQLAPASALTSRR
ncbi:MAG: hypothetical protein CFE28_02740 [Alphaproteobacteria bacterium PA2]|nr:MAG: hypothetical protein CFE28_02740 [Alphaproteobacteria bacterium PA2]